MKLKPDAVLRKQWFVPEAMSHPAKGHLGLWWEIFQKYTLSGQWVLDPMSGIGSSLIGAMMGRNVVCVEKEAHFVEPMRRSWLKMRQQVMLGCELGQVLILQGDARCLPLASLDGLKGRADCVVTSPPWEDKTALQDSKWLHEHEVELAQWFRESHAGEKGLPGNKRPENRKTMETYTRSDGYTGYLRLCKCRCGCQKVAIWGRPPFLCQECWEQTDADLSGEHGPAMLPRLDAIVTSPPYGALTSAEDHAQRAARTGGFRVGQESKYGDSNVQFLGKDPSGLNNQERSALASQRNNIGNLRGEKYWEAMRLVYGECRRVLAPGGVMVLVVKGYTRDGKYVDLPQQTVECCEALGFTFKERWTRELWNLSFWRILQQRRDPAAFDNHLRFESVLVLEKL